MSLEGQQLGRYRLERQLGSGGMGEVYLATDTLINRQVAIKLIRAEVASYPNVSPTSEAARLFQREMKTIAQLDHPHILPLFDYGEESVSGAKLSFLVMPFRQEGSLAAWLHEHSKTGLLSPRQVAHIVSQAAEALQHAHDRQIIHQDVKPANFLIRHRQEDPDYPDLMLADFGVAKFSTATTSASQSIRGTPTYMAPEQWAGHPVPASDQYALAIMAYELLTGRPPFQGPLMQVMYQHIHNQPHPPSSLNPRLTAQVDSILLRALAKQPEDRFASVSAFVRAFQQAIQGNGTGTPTWQSTGTPTIAHTMDIRATLAISKAEALAGTSRIVTLPDGQRISVSVPTGAYDGQIIRLERQGGPYGDASSAGTLTLIIAIVQTEKATSTFDIGAETVLNDSSSTVGATAITPASAASSPKEPPSAIPSSTTRDPSLTPQVNRDTGEATASTFDSLSNGKLTVDHRGPSRGKAVLLIGLALLVIAGGIGLFAVINARQLALNNAQATATAQAKVTNTANAQGTATANANATTTANAQGTATAYANATATAIVAQNPYGGKLVFTDTLANNSNGWCQFVAQCNYSAGALHIIDSGATGPSYVIGNPRNISLDFSNFAYEVEMKVLKGFGGGIIFRASNGAFSDLSQYYYLLIGTDGSFSFYLRNDSASNFNQTLSSGTSPSIHTGLNQSNFIAVAAHGSTLDLYVNQQLIASVNDSTYSHGTIGVFAYDSGHPNNEANPPVEVVFSNARVWTL